MRACENGQLAAAKVLVEANADINAQDKVILLYLFSNVFMLLTLRIALQQDGQTALFKASEAGHLDIVNFLLERSSNTNIQDKVDFPLHLFYQGTKYFLPANKTNLQLRVGHTHCANESNNSGCSTSCAKVGECYGHAIESSRQGIGTSCLFRIHNIFKT